MNRTVLAVFLGSWLIAGVASPQSGGVGERIRRVEEGLVAGAPGKDAPVSRWKLAERMKHYQVPGLSVAVINGGKIEWARGYGVVEAGGARAVTPETLFQAASISKPVAAMAALRLVEEGRLSLDEGVNGRLVSWKVPENEFTKEKKVTLRRILSHSAGLTVHGFRGYAVGEKVPTLLDVLEGRKPANSRPIQVDVVPGSLSRYSGGGYCVLQQMVEDVLKKPFAETMERTVLSRLGMRQSTYRQPLPRGLADRAATGHRKDGQPIPAKWYTYPEMAAAGLWTTPSDLARFAIELERSYAGRSNRVLSKEMIRQMLSRQMGGSGLGIGVDGEGPSVRFSHGGANEGFRCFLVAYRDSGRGAVVMTNGDGGGELGMEIIRAIAEEYEWPDYRTTTTAAGGSKQAK
jgi:CubicO group peptidase (beta-lactamase class C family)